MLLKPRYPRINAQHPLAKGLVGAWPFSEGGGRLVKDLSGYGNDGLVQTSGVWRSGVAGTELTLSEAGTQWVRVATGVPAALQVQAHTFCCILNWQQVIAASGFSQILGCFEGSSGFEWSLGSTFGASGVSFAFQNGGGTQGFYGSAYTPPAGTSMFVGVWDGSNIYVYNNVGALAATVATAAGPITYTSTHVDIGQRADSGTWYLNGSIPFFALWNRALTPGEIRQLYRDPFDIYRSDRWPRRGKASATSGAAVGAASGTGTATGVGASAAKSPGSAAGTGTATGVGASAAAAVGSASGTGTATGVGASAAGAGAASGTGTATGVGASAAAGVGAASGTGTASGVSPPAAPTAYASARANAVPAIPEDGAVDPQTLRTRLLMISRTVNLLLRGKANVVTTLTLTASATSTTLTDERIGPASYIALSPLTENATILDLAPYISSRSSGSAVITHGSTTASDCTYSVLILG